jgi:hypothetical protein
MEKSGKVQIASRSISLPISSEDMLSLSSTSAQRLNGRFLSAAAPSIFFSQNEILEQLREITPDLFERPILDCLCASRPRSRLTLTALL